MPEPFEETTELLSAYLDGSAPEERRAELERRLPFDPDLADRLALQARLSVMLEAMGRQESHRVQMAGDRTAPFRLKIAATAAAALVLTALATVLFLPPTARPFPAVASATEGVSIEHAGKRLAARPGLVLHAGDIVRTGTGTVTMAYPGEDTRVEVREGTEIRFPGEGPGNRMEVRRGELSASIASQPPGLPFRITTPHGRVEILGTRITLQVRPNFTRLEVREGRALLRKPDQGDSVEVEAGRFAVAEEGRALAAMPLPAEERGLKGEYFDNEDFTEPVLIRIDPRVDFTWGLGAPHPSMDPDYFSVRWTGLLEPDAGGETSFHVVSDDGVRLWVDGRLVIDDWKVRGTQERSGTVALEAGRRVEIRLEYFDCVSTANVHLSWSGPDRRKEIIPQERLIPAP